MDPKYRNLLLAIIVLVITILCMHFGIVPALEVSLLVIALIKLINLLIP